MTKTNKNKKNEDLEATHDSMIPLEETTHLTVIHQDPEHDTQPIINEIPRKKRKVTILRAQRILLVLAVALLITSIYAFRHADDIAQALRNNTTASVTDSASVSETSTYNALPTELTTPSSLTVLVDKTHSLPNTYVPENLTTPYLNSTTSVIELREEAGTAAQQMMSAAQESGLTIVITSGYRSYEEQQLMYQDRVDLVGEEQANKQIAKAGYSEHQTGLAIDFSNDTSSGANVTTAFGETDTGKWLYEHAHEYGFILRYPEGKEDITGYSYMPWHYRYVGVEIASAMYEISPDLTFEEYFQINQ